MSGENVFVLKRRIDPGLVGELISGAERERLLAEIDRLREKIDAEREKTWILTNAIADHLKAHLERWDGDEIAAENHSTDADKRLWEKGKR